MITFNQVSYRYPMQKNDVLKNINLIINRGDFCIIIGGNGSGKSTLFKLINQQCLPSSGNITLDPKLKHIAEVKQDISIGTIGEMTVLENLILSQSPVEKNNNRYKIQFNHFYKNHYKNKLVELGESFDQLIDVKMENLSGGQRQKIATLMAIHRSPSLLLLDEHTSALDLKSQLELMQLTEKLIQEKKITTIMITHDLDDALKFGNRLIVMHQGVILKDFSETDKQKLSFDELKELFFEFNFSHSHKIEGEHT